MNIMSELAGIESRVVALSSDLTSFEEKSKMIIQNDHEVIYEEVRLVLKLVDEVMLLADGTNSSASSLKVSTVRIRSNDINRDLEKLRVSASNALENVQRIQCSFQDFDSTLESLRAQLRILSASAENQLTSATTQLQGKKTEAIEAKDECDQKRAQLLQLNKDLSKRNENKDAMRSARFIAWTTTILFPPAIWVAGSLEIAARSVSHTDRIYRDTLLTYKHNRAMERERNKVETEIVSTISRWDRLSSEISKLKEQQQAIHLTVSTLTDVSTKADEIQRKSAMTRSSVIQSLRDYHNIQEGADEFKQWTVTTRDQAKTMGMFRSDNSSLGMIKARLRHAIGSVEEQDMTSGVLVPDENNSSTLLTVLVILIGFLTLMAMLEALRERVVLIFSVPGSMLWGSL
jgi:chromosome segregation ATPase